MTVVRYIRIILDLEGHVPYRQAFMWLNILLKSPYHATMTEAPYHEILKLTIPLKSRHEPLNVVMVISTASMFFN